MGIVREIVILLRAFLLPHAALAAEIPAIRHQLGVHRRSVRRPRLRQRVGFCFQGKLTRERTIDPVDY